MLSASQISQVTRVRLAVCIGLHLLADVILVSTALSLDDDGYIIVISVPLAQCSVFAILVSLSRLPDYLRYSIPVFSVIGCWFVISRLAPVGIDGSVSVRVTALAVSQVATTSIGVTLYRWWFDTVHFRATFRVGTLMVWTTVVAVAIALIRFAANQGGWTIDVLLNNEILVVAVVGTFYGALSLVWLHGFWTPRFLQRAWRLIVGALLVSAATVAFAYWIDWVCGSTFFLPLTDAICLTITQSVLVIATFVLLLLRRETAGSPV